MPLGQEEGPLLGLLVLLLVLILYLSIGLSCFLFFGYGTCFEVGEHQELLVQVQPPAWRVTALEADQSDDQSDLGQPDTVTSCSQLS